MVKNAFEASSDGDTVTIGSSNNEGHVDLWVHNSAVMPPAIQAQVFQRSFSTKGNGRGLGTYSMKLLGERYLKAKVSFTSSESKGTVFTIRCPSRI
jgi:sensor histidine kinase regulating citrate/malate metabolism